jgi:quercetin dioxygenase-like cupin family protein
MAPPAETGLPSAVQMTVLSGDPFKPGMFPVRLKIPDGGKVAPHWHPTDEHITVLQGAFAGGWVTNWKARLYTIFLPALIS